jgi:predicted DNA binding CopG/RHH family protein
MRKRKRIKKTIPKFKSAEEAAIFWENNDILEFFDEDEFEIVDPKKHKKYQYGKEEKDKTRLISIRISELLIEKAKELSEKKHLPYQHILKEWLKQGTSANIT